MWILLILLLIAGPAGALTYVPCDPVTIVGTQGRPIPNATVAITTTAGVPATSLFWDAAGSMVYDNTVPTSGVLQVFTNPGTYIFTVQGQGLMRRYYARCGVGLGEGVKTVSISRTAEMYVLEGSAALTCPATSTPCYVTLTHDHLPTQDGIRYSFVMPSYSLTFSSLLISYVSIHPNSPVGAKVRWYVDWCTYDESDIPCSPDGTNLQKFTDPSTGENNRSDTSLDSTSFSTTWEANDVVVLKLYPAFQDAINEVEHIRLYDTRLEFLRN